MELKGIGEADAGTAGLVETPVDEEESVRGERAGQMGEEGVLVGAGKMTMNVGQENDVVGARQAMVNGVGLVEEDVVLGGHAAFEGAGGRGYVGSMNGCYVVGTQKIGGR